jgi:hypothetical protein
MTLPPLPPLSMPRGPVAEDPPHVMTYPERARVRLAANRVNRMYPGPVGAVLSRELWSWEQLGWRFGADAPMAALVDHILDGQEEAA